MLGISFDQITSAVGGTNAAFKLTGIDSQLGVQGLKNLSLQIAENANVIESSKLIDFTKSLALQTRLGAQDAKLYGEQLIETAVRLGLPKAELLNLSQELLKTGVAFGSSSQQIEDLTFRSEALGRALGTTGTAVQRQLSGMMTIGQRQQLASRLSTIGSMVGARVDISKLLSADPEVQQAGITDALRSFSEQYQRIGTPARKRALFFALSKTLQLPAQAVQTALESGVDVNAALEKLAEARRNSEQGISDRTRQIFTKMTTRLDQLVESLRMQAGVAQLEVLRELTSKLSGNSDKNLSLLGALNNNLTASTKATAEASSQAAKPVSYTHLTLPTTPYV